MYAWTLSDLLLDFFVLIKKHFYTQKKQQVKINNDISWLYRFISFPLPGKRQDEDICQNACKKKGGLLISSADFFAFPKLLKDNSQLLVFCG